MPVRTMNRLVPLIAALLALVSGLIVLGGGATTADGARVLGLDDSYIHLQYGWQAAHGAFLQYTTGDAPSSGATSLLYMLLLAGGFALGISRAAMPGAALIFGLALFPLGAALLADLTRRAAERLHGRLYAAAPRFPAWSAGLLAGALFAASGWMAWAYLSGMETGLLITLGIATLWAMLTDRVRLTALLAALAVLTRPEAVILGGMLLVAQLLRDVAETNDRGRRFAWGLLPILALGVQPALNLILTGTLSASGLTAKSWFTLVPFYPGRVAVVIGVTWLELVAKLFGGPALDGRWHAFPLTQAFGLLGIGLLWLRGRVRERRLAVILLGWVLVSALATATLQTATWHHYRYQMPLYPALILPLALALVMLAEEFAQRSARLFLPAAAVLAVLSLAWAVFSLGSFREAYSLDTSTIVRQQMVLAGWLRENTPENARIAVHDVGVMRYVGERPTYDVVGLTTAGMSPISRSGPGAIYERLETVRPDYFAVYPDAAMPYFGLEDAPALLGEELFRVTADPWSPNTSAGSTQVVTRPDWSAVGLADSPRQPDIIARLADEGWHLSDTLDVADLDSEAAHAYAWWDAAPGQDYASVPELADYRYDPTIQLADGGRIMTGGERFTLDAPDEGWLLLVARVYPIDDLTVRVRIDGTQDAGVWKLPATPGQWLETAFLIPPHLHQARRGAVQIELTVEGAPPEARYRPFHYWLYRTADYTTTPQPPATVSGAIFAVPDGPDVVALRGFDLAERTIRPGETLGLTLHWQALDPPRADHRIFVHLMNPEDDSAAGILAQWDGQPRRGTYPFWVWQPHETLSQPVELAIPADAAPGAYRVLVGVYDGATNTRLVIIGGDDYGASRLILGTVTVR